MNVTVDLTPAELSYILEVVGDADAHEVGIPLYEKLYAVEQSPVDRFHYEHVYVVTQYDVTNQVIAVLSDEMEADKIAEMVGDGDAGIVQSAVSFEPV